MERSSLSSIDSEVDELIACGTKSEEECSDQLVSEIHPSLWFRRNSVNLVVGARGSGKTWGTLREILKCLMLRETDEHIPPYTQLFYINSKYADDSVKQLQPLLERYIQFHWIQTEDALKLIQVLEYGKANLDEPEFRNCLNADYLSEGQLPHSLLLFDDCAYLLSKPSELLKKLFQTRQARLTVFLMLQDPQSISVSAKSNLDSIILHGGFSRQKFNVLFYQLPPIEGFTYEIYSQLRKEDYVFIDFIKGTFSFQYRK